MKKRTAERNEHVDQLERDVMQSMTLGDALGQVQTDRRTWLKRAASLGLAIPVGSLLATHVSPAAGQTMSDAMTQQPTPPGGSVGSGGQQPGTGSGTPIPRTPSPFQPMDPFLPKVTAGAKAITLTAKEATVYIAKDVAYAGWSFEGAIPSRPLRVVEGDRVTFTVRNDAEMAHSLDTHAAKTPPNVNYPVVLPGKEYTWSFVAPYPGAYMYHCGTPPVLMHIAAGMYGAMIVDPKEGWPPAQELFFVQSEFYVDKGPTGIMQPDFSKMMTYGTMDYVVFNGYANQYYEYPIVVKTGQPIRIFVVNAGPNVWSSFHVVGAIFDRAYVNANPKNVLHGLQSISIGPGDGTCVELTLDEPGDYLAVNHAFGHAAHGAIATLKAI